MTKQELIEKVLKPIEDAGYKAFFVGGCVRDSIMGVEPHDYDITTNATPEQLHKVFNKFSNVSKNAERFGVTMPIIEKEEIEIATFRKDITKGRHPAVEITDSIVEDAMRRDFTCNALYEDIHGKIIDPTSFGYIDIKQNTLRFVGNAQDRIEEDPLRMLRMLRFISQKGFEFCDANFKAIPLEGVSKERQLKELIGIFGGKNIMEAFRLGIIFHIWEQIEPIWTVIASEQKTTQNPKWHAEGSTLINSKGILMSGSEFAEKHFGEDYTIAACGNVFDHTYDVMTEMSSLMNHDWIDMFAAFMHDCGKPIAAKTNGPKNPGDRWDMHKQHDIFGAEFARVICKELGISNADTNTICYLIEKHMIAHDLAEKSKSTYWPIVDNKLFSRLFRLAICDENGCTKLVEDERPGILTFVKSDNFKEVFKKPMPKPILTGTDLIKRGYKPGPKFKHALEIAYDHQIDFGTTDKQTLLLDIKSYMKGK